LQITATDLANKRAILPHLQAKFVGNDLTAVTLNNDSPVIQIYVFRTRFSSGGGGPQNGGGGGPQNGGGSGPSPDPDID
jgi:hypothetical protein